MELTELVNWLLIWREKGDSGILFGELSEQWYPEPRAAAIAVIMDWGTPYVQCVCVCARVLVGVFLIWVDFVTSGGALSWTLELRFNSVVIKARSR